MTLLSAGSNSQGQLGTGDFEDRCVFSSCRFESKGLALKEIRSITGGANHSLCSVIDSEGQYHLFGAGSNSHGQLGISKDIKSIDKFTKIAISTSRIRKLAAGWSHSLVLDEDGSLYGFGDNSHGQLGILESQSNEPLLLNSIINRMETIPTKFVDIDCGLHYSVAIDDQGRVWVWGRNRHGELGNFESENQSKSCIEPPHLLENCSEPMIKVACGQHHVLLFSENSHQIYSLGWNKFGQLGRILSGVVACGTSQKVELKLESSEDLIIDIFAGWNYSCALTQTGHVYLWGRCDKGQLGLNPKNCSVGKDRIKMLSSGILFCPIPVRNPFLRSINRISLGSEHGLALSSQSRPQLFAWGWNEHGNCGSGNTSDIIDHPKMVLELDPSIAQQLNRDSGESLLRAEKSQTLMVIGCGYGHTMIAMSNK